MNDPAPFEVRSIPGRFGAAEVVGFDVDRHPSDADARAALSDALWEHGVVCIRLAAPLDDAAARAVATMVGPIKDPVGRGTDGSSIRYADDRQVIDSGFVMTEELREQLGGGSLGGDDLRPGLFEFFHTDDSYTEQPAAATVLHARALPDGPGGDTCFLDMRDAFRSLDSERQRRILGLTAVHAYNNQGAFPPRAAATGPLEQLVDVAHPVVRAHPLVGTPALYFDLDRATHIADLPEAEGRALLQSLQDHAEQHAAKYCHQWRPHDVLLWDNASVQHRASGDFPIGQPRRFWRYMIEGTRPRAARG